MASNWPGNLFDEMFFEVEMLAEDLKSRFISFDDVEASDGDIKPSEPLS